MDVENFCMKEETLFRSRLRRRTDGKCPACGRKLAIRPLSISFQETDGDVDNIQKIS